MAGLLTNDRLYYLLFAYDKHHDDGCRWLPLISHDDFGNFFPAHKLIKQLLLRLAMAATA